MKMFARIVLLVTVCVLVYSTEPECTRFDYVVKTLEKVIKTENYVDKIKSETENMQQRMSEKLDGIRKDLEKTERELNDAKEDNKNAVEEIKDRIDGLSTVQSVAFLAHNIKDTGPSDGATMVFSTTAFDVGSGYNNKTGVFKTPVAGIYMFTLQLCISGYSYFIFEISTGKGPILKGCLIDDESTYNGCNTATTVAVLDAKEHVSIKKVRSSSGSSDFWKNSDIWNSFSGVLISAVTK